MKVVSIAARSSALEMAGLDRRVDDASNNADPALKDWRTFASATDVDGSTYETDGVVVGEWNGGSIVFGSFAGPCSRRTRCTSSAGCDCRPGALRLHLVSFSDIRERYSGSVLIPAKDER